MLMQAAADSQGSGTVRIVNKVRTCSRCQQPIASSGEGCHETAPNSGHTCCHAVLEPEAS